MAFQIGDIIEIKLRSGQFGYVQYCSDGPYVAFVRILSGLFDAPLPSTALAGLAARQDRFVYHAPLEALVSPHNNGRLVGNEPVPQDRLSPPVMREFCPPSAENPDGWVILAPDDEVISGRAYAEQHPEIDQTMLPTPSIPFVPKLARMIGTGWSPKMAANGVLNIPRFSHTKMNPLLVTDKDRKEGVMGSWGSGAFENDEAMDWLAELADQSDWNFVSQALQDIALGDDYLEAPDGAIAMAAAATVAVGLAGGTKIPQEVGTFLACTGVPDKSMAQVAVQALDRVRSDKSELLSLWQEADSLDQWSEEIDSIRERLTNRGMTDKSL